MKKRTISKLFLMAGLVSGLAVLSSCNNGQTPNPSTVEPVTQTVVDPATQSTVEQTTTPAVASATLTMHADPYNVEASTTVSVELTETDETTGVKYGIPQVANPTNDYKNFVGWYTDSEFTTPINLADGIEGNTEVWAKWESKYEVVESGFAQTTAGAVSSWADLAAATGLSTTGNSKFGADTTVGAITFGTNVQLEPTKTGIGSGTGCINTQGKKITFTLTGKTNEIHISAGAWASSSAKGTLKIVKGEQTVYESDEYNGNNTPTAAIDLTNLEAGTYEFTSGASCRIASITVKQELELAPVSGFEVAGTAKSSFLIGEVASLDDLKAALNVKVNKVFANSKVEEVKASDDKLTIDASQVSLTAEGEYSVLVKYGDYEAKEVKVKMFAVDSIELGMYELDGSRVTKHVQEVYLNGQTANTNHLSIIAHAKCGTSTLDFNLPLSKGTVNEDANKLVTVTYQEKTASFQRYYLASSTATDGEITVTVDASKDVSTTNFKTITQAMQYLEALQLDASVSKVVKLAAGTYNEKVEVTLPNVQLVGFEPTSQVSNAELQAGARNYVVTFNALAGQKDPAGKTAHSTDGSSTFSVRSTAVGFKAVGITFENYYNTHERYAASKKLMNDTQAVAAYVEADQSLFYGCVFSSYHDTLYANKGRQIYMGCYIEGRTDYIFGGGVVTAYFYQDTIHTLVGELTSEGVAKDKNGGYVACTKGSAAAYDYIFNECTFEADDAVLDGSVSLGRTWDTNMKLMIMNSSISGKYSLTDFGHGVDGYNTRYTEMNKGKSPKAANIFEYNNTGAGALASAEGFTSVSLKTAEEAAKFSQPIVVFAPVEGTWSDTWYEGWWPIPAADKADAATLTVFAGSTSQSSSTYAVGMIVSEKTIRTMFEVQDGELVAGFYDDAAFTTKHDFSKGLVANNTIYVLIVKGTPNKFAYNYSDEAHAEAWAETFTPNAETGEAVTISSADSTAVTAKKITGTDNITLTIPASKYINFESLKGFTNGSSKASAYAVIKLMAGDEVVATLTGTTPADKKLGNFTFAGDATSAFLVLDKEVTKIVFTCGTSGKGYALTEIKVTAYVEAQEQKTYNEEFKASSLTAAADKEKITQADLGNFFTLVGAGDKRLSNGAVSSVEFKNAGVSFTVESKVTFTAKVASTGGSNMSVVGLYDEAGATVAATSITRVEGDVIGVTNNLIDVYTSGKATTVVYTLNAGTYTFKGLATTCTGGTYDGAAKPSANCDRPARFLELSVVNA